MYTITERIRFYAIRKKKHNRERYQLNSEYKEYTLKNANERYKNDPDYRETTKKRARERYHNDPAYRKATIKRSRARNKKVDKSA